MHNYKGSFTDCQRGFKNSPLPDGHPAPPPQPPSTGKRLAIPTPSHLCKEVCLLQD
ncbi:MAG: hypothetical protein U0X87_00400 [Anaerolineales bacterium]